MPEGEEIISRVTTPPTPGISMPPAQGRAHRAADELKTIEATLIPRVHPLSKPAFAPRARTLLVFFFQTPTEGSEETPLAKAIERAFGNDPLRM